MNTAHAISVRNLTKTYPARMAGPGAGSGSPVLNGISFEVRGGEIFGLLGANGAGKTTLVDILATHLLPTSGQAQVCSHDVVKDWRVVRRLVGHAPSTQDSFFPRLSVRQNLEFFATVYDVESSAIPSRIEGLLRLVGLVEMADRSFQKLSLGMQQRLALARALLADPPVLLLDEPTRSLDPAMQREFYSLLRLELRDRLGKAILLVTHSVQEAGTVCDRLGVLSRGALAFCGTPAQFLDSAGSTDWGEAYARVTGNSIDAASNAAPGNGGNS